MVGGLDLRTSRIKWTSSGGLHFIDVSQRLQGVWGQRAVIDVEPCDLRPRADAGAPLGGVASPRAKAFTSRWVAILGADDPVLANN